MKLTIPLLSLSTLVAAVAAGCAETASEEPAPIATPAAVSGAVDSIAGCNGQKSCTDAVVLRALMTSDLELTEMFMAPNQDLKLAREHFAAWMRPAKDTFSTFEITTKALGGGRYTVGVSMGTAEVGDGANVGGCDFSFTLDHDRVVERVVEAYCAS